MARNSGLGFWDSIIKSGINPGTTNKVATNKSIGYPVLDTGSQSPAVPSFNNQNMFNNLLNNTAFISDRENAIARLNNVNTVPNEAFDRTRQPKSVAVDAGTDMKTNNQFMDLQREQAIANINARSNGKVNTKAKPEINISSNPMGTEYGIVDNLEAYIADRNEPGSIRDKANANIKARQAAAHKNNLAMLEADYMAGEDYGITY